MTLKGLGTAAVAFIVGFTIIVIVGKTGQKVSREITNSDTYKKGKAYAGRVIDNLAGDHKDTVYIIQKGEK